MSVLIKNMKMPTSCSECELNYDCFKCIATGTPFFNHERNFDDETARLDNCPLVSVPPHGRLIDADTLTVEHGWLDNFDNTHTHIQFVYANEIYNTPTIIESEEEK